MPDYRIRTQPFQGTQRWVLEITPAEARALCLAFGHEEDYAADPAAETFGAYLSTVGAEERDADDPWEAGQYWDEPRPGIICCQLGSRGVMILARAEDQHGVLLVPGWALNSALRGISKLCAGTAEKAEQVERIGKGISLTYSERAYLAVYDLLSSRQMEDLPDLLPAALDPVG